MARKRLNIESQVTELYYQLSGNITHIANAIGCSRDSVSRTIKKLRLAEQPLAEGQIKEISAAKWPSKNRCYIFTSAQNNTHIHKKIWENLLALADYYNARICVGTFTYNKNRYGPMAVKRGTYEGSDRELWYDPAIDGYIVDRRVEVARGLEWNGEMNILPTAENPLSGFEVYNGRRSGIFPHVKVEMRSVASNKDESTKFNYTTGTITQRNYIQKKAGLKAESHHSYGGLLVEVDSNGDWFARQVLADNDGTIYDLEYVVKDGVVSHHNGVEAITWGDIHSLLLDSKREAVLQDILNTLEPKYQFFHDLLLGSVISHHDWKNPHEQFRKHCRGGGWNSFTEELKNVKRFLERMHRDNCKSVIVDSNHDKAWIERWLRETDYRKDPENAITFLRLQLAYYLSIKQDPNSKINIFQLALESPKFLRFLDTDESFTITRKKIECGWHGHLGSDGRRGSPETLCRMGRKANIAHTHSAGIYKGLYVAGLSSTPDMGYNHGPSSWSFSHIVTYPNGKRAVITVWNNKWSAHKGES